MLLNKTIYFAKAYKIKTINKKNITFFLNNIQKFNPTHNL